MSTFGKQSISVRKKDVAPSRSPAVAVRKIRFAHKATSGQTLIDLNALTTPSAEMPTFVNASAAEIAAARLTINKKNLSLKSSLGGMLIQDLDYVVVTATSILLIGNYQDVGAADGEIFEGVIDQAPVSDLIVSEGRNIRGTVEVAVGQTTVNLGSIFKVNENAADQIGSVKIWRNGVLQARNAGNATASPSADGNYQEIDAGNGYGTTIELNNAPAVQADLIQFEIGFHTYNGDVSIFADLERQQGIIQKLAEDAAVAFGNPVTDYLTASPTEQERRAFGDQVLDHEDRIQALEANPNIELFIESGNGRGSTANRIRRFANVRKNSLNSYATYTDSATDGSYVTINRSGRWFIEYSDYNSGAAISFGISVNSNSDTTTAVTSLTYGTGRRAWCDTPSGIMASVSQVINLNAGDIVRPHTSATAGTDADTKPHFQLVYLGAE